jgi:hypothetical protein
VGLQTISEVAAFGADQLSKNEAFFRTALATSCLETDRPENVRFYGDFGFETTAEIRVSGVPNFLMWCKAGSSAA